MMARGMNGGFGKAISAPPDAWAIRHIRARLPRLEMDEEIQRMKEGLCEAVAAERSIAGGEGSPGDAIAEDAAAFVLDTSIDLAGNPCPERLTMDERRLMVGNLVGTRRSGHRREWRWEQIEAFRVEPAVGSHFLQAQVNGQWIDALRRPGNVARELTDLLGRLNARCRQNFRATPGEAKNGKRKPRRIAARAIAARRRRLPRRCE